MDDESNDRPTAWQVHTQVSRWLIAEEVEEINLKFDSKGEVMHIEMSYQWFSKKSQLGLVAHISLRSLFRPSYHYY